MAFTPPAVEYELDFTGTELDGLTVVAHGADIGAVLDLASMVDLVDEAEDDDPDDVSAEKIKRFGKTMDKMSTIINTYADVLVSWDLEVPAGNPVPADASGLRKLQTRHLMMIIKAWQAAVSAVPDELGKDSNSGAPSPVASLQMEPLSPSLAS